MKKRILLVDDDIALLGIMKILLEQSGYVVKAVHRGSEAVRLFLASPQSFDLVILDQAMPDLQGTEIAQRFTLLRPGLPILLYTGSLDDDLATMARKIGVKEVASKSLTGEELLDVIVRTLDTQRGPLELSGQWGAASTSL